MKKILISSPSSTAITFLPYIYGVLKTHCEETQVIRENYQWLKPIYKRSQMSEIDKICTDHEISILGLSCYVWNFQLQIEIAKKVKGAYSDCLVVAGGPEPDWNDPDFFKKYPEIDVVVMQDGEIPFQKILERKISTSRLSDFQDIPGLILNINGQATKTAAPELIKNWSDKSPYASQPEFAEIAKELPFPAVILETNRGCPYSCQFCDWGSNTFSKIRTFSEKRVNDEIKWIAENQIHRVYTADANFGILERDLSFASEFSRLKALHDWPKIVDICISKSHINRVTEICTTLAKASLLKGALVGFQSTNEAALAAMKRKNLSMDEHKFMLNQLKTVGATAYGTLIIGCPEDTLEDFMNSAGDLLDSGYDKAIRYYLYALLPNAPASKPEYLEKYQIQSVKRKLVDFELDPEGHKNPLYPQIKYIVSHAKLSTDDFKHECLFIAFTTAFEVLGLTKIISNYYKRKFGLSKKDFYKKIFYSIMETNTPLISTIKQQMMEHYSQFVENTEAHFFIQINPKEYLCEPERLIFLNIVESVNQFYTELETLLKSWPEKFSDEVTDLFDYQKFMTHKIKAEDITRSVSLKYNWTKYFQQPQDQSELSLGKYSVQTNIYDDNLNWLAEGKELRWKKYREHIIRSYSYKDGITLIPEASVQLSSEVTS